MSTRATDCAWFGGDLPRKTPSLARLCRFGMLFPDVSLSWRTYVGQPNGWKCLTRFKQEGRKERKGKAQEQSKEDGQMQVLHRVGGNEETIDRQEDVAPSNDDGADEEPITAGQPADPSEAQTQDHQPANETTTVRKWSKRHKPTQRLIESQEQESARYAAYISKNREVFDENSDTNDYDQDVYHGVEEYKIQRQMSDPSIAIRSRHHVSS